MARNEYFIGVDVGSASVRAGVFDAAGNRVGFATRPISQHRPRADFVEQSSSEIWERACGAVKEAVARAGIGAEQVRALGYDATCSLVAVDERGRGVSVSETAEPEHDIIMWMDHRAGEEQAEINATNDDALRYVGGQVSVEMELPKILWLKRRLPERYLRTWRFFDLADYLVWRATGRDVAGGCALTCKWNYLAHEGRFSEMLLSAVGLTDVLTKIPQTVLKLGEKAGHITAETAERCGLTTDVVVASGIIDAHAGGLALVGGHPEGRLAVISGTSNCHMIVSRQPIPVPGVWGPYWEAMLPDWWLNEGGQSAAGALVEWTIRQGDAWPALQAEAARRECSVYAVLNEWTADLERREPFPTRRLHVLGDHHGNRSPRANPRALGAIYGLTLEEGADALARLYLATLQAVAYGTRHVIDAMREAGHRISHLSLCGGATKNPLWVREYANVTGCDIQLAADEDVVTLGAAVLGAAACGRFASLPEAVTAMAHSGGAVVADPSCRAFHDAKYRVYLQMYDDLQRAEREMRCVY